jgi:hypothetical protein
MQSKNSQIDNQTTGIPEGFVEVIGPNSKAYLVPEFYAPALHNTLDGMEEKKKLKIEKAEGTVSLSILYPTVADNNIILLMARFILLLGLSAPILFLISDGGRPQRHFFDGPIHSFARPFGPYSFPYIRRWPTTASFFMMARIFLLLGLSAPTLFLR